MGRSRRVILIEDLGHDARNTEESQSAGQSGRFSGQCRLEPSFRNILVVDVRGILGMNVVLIQQPWQAEQSSREALSDQRGQISARRANLPI